MPSLPAIEKKACCADDGLAMAERHIHISLAISGEPLRWATPHATLEPDETGVASAVDEFTGSERNCYFIICAWHKISAGTSAISGSIRASLNMWSNQRTHEHVCDNPMAREPLGSLHDRHCWIYLNHDPHVATRAAFPLPNRRCRRLAHAKTIVLVICTPDKGALTQ